MRAGKMEGNSLAELKSGLSFLNACECNGGSPCADVLK